MFLPARMERILVSGHKDRLESTISALQSEGAVHLEDFQDPTGITGFGSPLAAGDAASARLLRVRGLQKAIGAEAIAAKQIPNPDEMEPLVIEAERAISPTVKEVHELAERIADLQAQEAALRPFDGAELDMDAMHGIESLNVIAGRVTSDPSEAIHESGIEVELFTHRGPAGLVVIVVLRPEHASAVEQILLRHGLRVLDIPLGEGRPSSQLARLAQQKEDLNRHLKQEKSRLANLRGSWGARLAAMAGLLQQEVDRTQAPLRFAVTDNTFHVEGWIPKEKLNGLQNRLAHEVGENLFVQALGDVLGPEDVDDEHSHAHVHAEEGHHAHVETSPAEEPPIHLLNRGPAKKYQFLLSLLALPRYKEIDPTKLIAIFFPIYFGLMVGDVIIGALIVGMALWLRNNRLFGMGGDGIAKPMMWGGIWAILIGALVFGEGAGLHFVISDEAAAAGEYSWETAFGVHFPDEGFIHKSGGYHADAADHVESHSAEEEAAASLHAETATESKNILTPHHAPHLSVNGWFNLGIYSKIHDIQALLVWSVMIGVVHLILGLVLGVRNVYVSHGLKLAVQEKVSWLMIMASGAGFVIGILGGMGGLMWGSLAAFLVAMVLLWQGTAHTLGVGFVSILEVFGLIGNMLSYTRLAAIGASKAGMAIAFAIIGLDVIGGAFGMIFYLLSLIVITLLAILAGFLQSLRLQFVEFFSKFYEGGGRPYVPFGSRAANPPSTP